MKKRLQRILSILCILALMSGCVSALADDVIRVISVKWADEDNYDKKRPDSVDMTIETQNGTTATVTLNETNNWTDSVAAPSGKSWTLATVSDYSRSDGGTADADVTVVTYSHSIRKTDITGKVNWDDDDNYGGIRPDSVQLRLMADGVPYGVAKTASKSNSWTVVWSDVPETKPNNGGAVTYTVEPIETVSGYKYTQAGQNANYTLERGNLTVTASVAAPDGKDVSGFKATVYGPDPMMPKQLTLGQMSGGYTFSNVLAGAYVIQEDNGDSLVEGYVMDPGKSKVGDAALVQDGQTARLEIKYTYREPADVEPNETPEASFGSLLFVINGPDPIMPHYVTYDLFVNGKYELDNLQPGTYYVIEMNAETLVQAFTLTSSSTTGMTITVSSDGTATAKLFNQYVAAPTPEPDDELISIPVTKIWNDNNNKDGNRPSSVTVNLYADTVKVDSAALSAENSWTYTFENKPARYADGTEIKYTVGEDPVPWYTSVVKGYIITNNYEPEVTSATVIKQWNDKDNTVYRPKTLAVTLLPVGKVYVLSEKNGWTLTVDNLPTKINGKPVTYKWSEQEVRNYVQEFNNTNGTTTVIQNRVTKLPEPEEGHKKDKRPKGGFAFFEGYQTALGIEVIINHVGDCFD